MRTKSKFAAIFACATMFLLFTVTLFFGFATATQSVATHAAQDDKVYLGGSPVGIIQNADGAVITKIAEVETAEGKISPVGAAGGRVGDIINKINGKEIKSSADIRQAIDEGGDTVILTLLRNENVFDLAVRPAYDMVIKEKKLGILMKDSIAGVGTLTFIRPDLTYGALGHRICDNVASNKGIYRNGTLYRCNIIGYVKGIPGEAGELKGTFNRADKPTGRIEQNLFCGIFGKFLSGDAVVGRELTVIGHRKEIVPGAAKIYTTINGKTPAYYNIEIVKVCAQNEAKEKSMVLRVTDPILLKETGGIVQGMSGSPILQNGKIIGAVTHVFVNDPTSGYGIYLDWMLQH